MILYLFFIVRGIRIYIESIVVDRFSIKKSRNENKIAMFEKLRASHTRCFSQDFFIESENLESCIRA